jgi:hypothetical protein
MIIEGSCTAAWASSAGYRWDALVIGADALAKRKRWLAAQGFDSSTDVSEFSMLMSRQLTH